MRLVTFEMCIQVIRLMIIDGTVRRNIKDRHFAMIQVCYHGSCLFNIFIKTLHAFFVSNVFFFNPALLLLNFLMNWAWRCCLSVAYYIQTSSNRDTYICVFVSVFTSRPVYVLFMWAIFHCNFHFHNNWSFGAIKTDMLVSWDIFLGTYYLAFA